MNILDYYQSTTSRRKLAELLSHASMLHEEGLPKSYIEKDLWVTEVLRLLYDEKLLGDFSVAFKGGTALSKCWKVIDRFSEDIDLSIHWTELAGAEDEKMAWEQSVKSRKQRDKFRDLQSKRLTEWSEELVNTLNTRFDTYGIPDLRAELNPNSKGEQVTIRWPSIFRAEENYLRDHILLEFGGRNRGQPTVKHSVSSYMSDIPEFGALTFPVASVDAFHPEYILWEKLTALHQFSTMEREPKTKRLSRHWYDVDRLLSKRIADPISSVEARNNVVRMKSMRWEEKGVDYGLALQGKLKLVPPEALLVKLKQDHEEAMGDGFFFINRNPDSFDEIIERLASAECEINAQIAAQFDEDLDRSPSHDASPF